jgi:Condensation domain/TubC N-terminal docking domain
MLAGDEGLDAGLTAFLGAVHSKGVRLWQDKGQLRYTAPKGALTHDELERLRGSRERIVELLGTASNGGIVEPGRAYAPLTFTQLAHWRLYRLDERRSLRQVATAIRWLAPLDVPTLRHRIAQTVQRHDALRTRIRLLNGTPQQVVSDSDSYEWSFDDLTSLPKSARESKVTESIESFILQPIDIAVDALLGIRHLKLDHQEHVLIVAMEHMISDAYSLGLFLRDVFTSYHQVTQGHLTCLPPVPVQFTEFARRQSSEHNRWLENHDTYWRERLTTWHRFRFPVDDKQLALGLSGWSTVPVRLEKECTSDLREWCRLQRTTLAMGVFTAYAALVLRWCKTPKGILQYEIDSRINRSLENTIGYFASPLYLHVELLENDRFADLVRRITQEYCVAHDHADFSYLESQLPRPDFTRSTCFNWIPQGIQADLEAPYTPIPFEHPMLKTLERDNEPVILLFDTGQEISGSIHFPLDRFSVPMMETFTRAFLTFIEALLRHPHARVRDVAFSSMLAIQ